MLKMVGSAATLNAQGKICYSSAALIIWMLNEYVTNQREGERPFPKSSQITAIGSTHPVLFVTSQQELEMCIG